MQCKLVTLSRDRVIFGPPGNIVERETAEALLVIVGDLKPAGPDKLGTLYVTQEQDVPPFDLDIQFLRMLVLKLVQTHMEEEDQAKKDELYAQVAELIGYVPTKNEANEPNST